MKCDKRDHAELAKNPTVEVMKTARIWQDLNVKIAECPVCGSTIVLTRGG